MASFERYGSARDAVSQRLAVDQLEHQRLDTIGVFESVDRADVGMIQRGQYARFALEPRAPLSIARERGRQNLDGDLAAEFGVARAIHLTHAPGTKLRQDPIRADVASDQIQSQIPQSLVPTLRKSPAS